MRGIRFDIFHNLARKRKPFRVLSHPHHSRAATNLLLLQLYTYPVAVRTQSFFLPSTCMCERPPPTSPCSIKHILPYPCPSSAFSTLCVRVWLISTVGRPMAQCTVAGASLPFAGELHGWVLRRIPIDTIRTSTIITTAQETVVVRRPLRKKQKAFEGLWKLNI